jgi:outer membrane biosynthesis protein TonB
LSAVSFNLIFAPFTVRPTGNPMSEDDMTRLALEQSRGAPDFDATVDSLAVSPTRTRTLVLKLGNMARPLAAMRTCVDDMFKTWGGDPAVQKSLTRAARPVIRTVWKVQGDYPAAMLLRGTSAYVPVRVSVDSVGNPSKCVVQIEGVDKAFKDSVCDDIMHKFEPALDKDGKPVATIVSTSVLYLVDNSKPERNVD